MSTVLIVFRKELRETLRDRHTLITMVAIPLLLFPLLIGGMAKFTTTRMRAAQERTARVGKIVEPQAHDLVEWLATRPDIAPCTVRELSEGVGRLELGELDAVIALAPGFAESLRSRAAGGVHLHYRAAERRSVEVTCLLAMLEEYADLLRARRFPDLGLAPTVHRTLVVHPHNLATPKARVAEVVGGFLPYLCIFFCFTGCMLYQAIGLAAGEKERMTLETLVTTHAHRTFAEFFGQISGGGANCSWGRRCFNVGSWSAAVSDSAPGVHEGLARHGGAAFGHERLLAAGAVGGLSCRRAPVGLRSGPFL